MTLEEKRKYLGNFYINLLTGILSFYLISEVNFGPEVLLVGGQGGQLPTQFLAE